MCPHFDDALVNHGDLIRSLNGGQPVRDGKRGPGLLLLEPVESRLHHLQFWTIWWRPGYELFCVVRTPEKLVTYPEPEEKSRPSRMFSLICFSVDV